MFAQYIFDKALSTKPNSIIHKIFLKLRNVLSNDKDILVKFNYHNYKLKLPISHDYPFNLKRNPEYSQNLGKIASIIKGKYPDTTAIDVGANIGDSALILNHFTFMPVLCVEGNPKFIPLLKENTSQLGNVALCEYFVGESEETVVAINYLGTSRLEKSTNGSTVKTMDQILEMFPEYKKAKLLKIDTDGFDNKIIRASKNYLKESNAIVFFEYDPRLLAIQNEHSSDIFDFLHELGYRRMLLFDNLGSFLCEVPTDNKQLLNDLTAFYKRDKYAYLDICAVHEQDNDLIGKIREIYP